MQAHQHGIDATTTTTRIQMLIRKQRREFLSSWFHFEEQSVSQ
jgi:hypothetical protein